MRDGPPGRPAVHCPAPRPGQPRPARLQRRQAERQVHAFCVSEADYVNISTWLQKTLIDTALEVVTGCGESAMCVCFQLNGRGSENGTVRFSFDADANVDYNLAIYQQNDAAWSLFHTVRLVVVEYKVPASSRCSTPIEVDPYQWCTEQLVLNRFADSTTPRT